MLGFQGHLEAEELQVDAIVQECSCECGLYELVLFEGLPALPVDKLEGWWGKFVAEHVGVGVDVGLDADPGADGGCIGGRGVGDHPDLAGGDGGAFENWVACGGVCVSDSFVVGVFEGEQLIFGADQEPVGVDGF